MSTIEKIGLAALHKLDPEHAHKLSLMALKYGLSPRQAPVTSSRLRTTIAGLDLPNPVGLAAGFDKNATVIAPLLRSGFGFIEVGAATPKPQPGNPKPRLFRLTEDQAAINRFGFNNQGAAKIAQRLARRPSHGIVGLNLGANKDSADRAADYAQVLETCGRYVDFVTVNVSSPNTANLRDLQAISALSALLEVVNEARARASPNLPVFLKISPDLKDDELAGIADVAMRLGIAAIIATNTTLSRDGLKSHAKSQAGGLSGAPLFERSTRVLALLAQHCAGRLPLIGVGGIGSAEQAYTKIKAGASAVQIYTSMVFQGISVINEITAGLERLLRRDGFSNIAQAVGIEMENYQ